MSADITDNSVEDCTPGKILGRVDEAICALNGDGEFTFVNERAAAMLERSPDELLGRDVWEALSDISETTVEEELQQALSTQTSTRFESYQEELDRWVKVCIYPDENGATAFFYDISDERSERIDAQRQRRLFETVFKETEDALIVADTDRRITEFNPAAERLFGYETTEVIGEETRLLYADEAEYDRQGDRRFNDQAPVREETYLSEYERADGTTFTGETFGTALKAPDNDTLAFLGSIRDVSAQIEYEQALESHNDALAAFHDISTDDDRSVGERIDAILEVGSEYLGLDLGIFSTIDGDEYTAERVTAPDDAIRPGDQFDLGETFCDLVIDTEELVAVANAGDSELAAHPAYQSQGLESYIGTSVVVDGERYGTLNFSQTAARQRPFTEGERTVVRIFAQWIGKELSRRQNKQRAAANRDRLRQIIDLLPQLVFAKDRDNEYILVNQALADAYGSTVEEVEGSTDADFVTSEAEAKQFQEDDLAVINSGEQKVIPEEPLTKADGETVTLQTTKIPYDPVDHDREAVLGVATDVTDAKQRERELEEISQRLTVALEATNAGVWELNLETEDVVWTESMEQLFGLEPGASDGTYEEFLEPVHPDDVPTVRESLESVTADGDTLQVEYRIEQDDGTQLWIEARAELHAGTNTTRRLVGIATDITERKERDAEIELQAAAMEVAMDGIAILDGDEYVYMNQAHADIFEYDPEELLGCEWRDLYGDAEIERIETQVFPELTETGSWRGETRGRKQDGTLVHQDLGLSILDSGELICTNRDITAQKEREQELMRQRTRIRALFDNSPDGIVIHDAEGAVFDVNETMAESLGYDRETLCSMHVAEFEAGIDQSELSSIWSEMELNDILKVEGRHRRRDGETFPVEVWVNKVEVGGDTRYIAVARDITEQKRLERSLRESEQSVRELTGIASDTDRGFEAKLTALLELGTERLGIPYGFLNKIENGTQHVIQAVGDHPQLRTGASAPKSESYCRKTIQQAGPLAIQDSVAEGWKDDAAYKRFDLGCYIGGTVTVDGEMYGTLCFADQHAREHEFTDTERAFVKLLVQWASHELATESFETKLHEINETAQRLMAVPSTSQIASIAVESAKSILQMPMTGVWWYDEERETLVPEVITEEASEYIGEQPTFERGTALAWDAFEAGTVQIYDDLSAVDGLHNEETDLNSEAIVPLGDHGVMIAGSAENRDFSETDFNLLEVLSSTVEAALTRAERETVLRETQQQLKQSNEELEQFAYAASHDLQEPLRTISSYLTLLDRRYGDDLDDDAAEFIEFAVDGADRMRNMIQALLAYSRVDTRGESFEVIDISELFERVTASLDVKITETDATVSLPATEATVFGDANQLSQLFQNLVENGIKYNTEQPEIDISVSHHDGMVTFDVADNGIGMEADQIDEIFEVFQRLHTREEFEGTGIGLSICRKIVDRHGGEITVESRPREGSTFRISLPTGADTNE
ncbi:PAS domain S-box protein [Halorubrum sp. Boch-26]|uniref:PAS domain S-box protein n=1 Tax=Halorubrum sp. Boch-26 TaxID=2994426 RepID=UPI002468901F|nr:PAS domain S-box protein [Halorubrum sp. Boch-26]